MTAPDIHSHAPLPVLQIKNLFAGYGTKEVLRDVSFDVRPGEIISLLGINGAGKSTCFKTIVGLLRPLRGRIDLRGVNISDWSVPKKAREGIVLVPEGARSFADLSVRENIELSRFVVKSAEIFHDRFDDVLTTFPMLKQRLNEKAGTLSGGERQMLAIARALILRPIVLFIDEPFLGLAPIMIGEVVKRLTALRERVNCGIVLAEQNVAATLRVADRALLVQSGRIESIDPGTSPNTVHRLLLNS